MIENITFVLPSGEQVIPEDYGLILKSFEAPPPKAKANLISIAGRDGDLDLTEWAGETRFENRSVKMAFRDMQGEEYSPFLDKIHGAQCKIIHSVDNTLYYSGRCVSAEAKTERHVTDVELEFSCHPYRLFIEPKIVSETVTNNLSIPLKAKRMSAVPTITLTAACSVTFDGITKSLTAGTHTVAEFVITRTQKSMTVSGSGTITITWAEGVI